MKKRRRADVTAAVKTTASGVTIKLKLEFPGAIMKPPGPAPPLQYVEEIQVRCRWCRSTSVRCIKGRERDLVYRCFSCVDPETNTWTVFTVGRRAPEGPPGSKASPRS